MLQIRFQFLVIHEICPRVQEEVVKPQNRFNILLFLSRESQSKLEFMVPYHNGNRFSVLCLPLLLTSEIFKSRAVACFMVIFKFFLFQELLIFRDFFWVIITSMI